MNSNHRYGSVPAWLYNLFGLFLAGVGVYFLLTGIRFLADSPGFRLWPTVSGEVVSAKVLENKGLTGAFTPQVVGGRVILGAFGQNSSSNVEVVYQYRIQGQLYKGVRVYSESIPPKESSIVTPKGEGEALKRFHPGEKLVVYYSPANPAVSALENGVRPEALNNLRWGTVLVIGGLGLIGIRFLWNLMHHLQSNRSRSAV